MTTKKRQHFVPKSYLKRFAANAEGTFINIINLARERAIPRASVRDQCHRDYFYGRDLSIEEALSGIEGGMSALFEETIVSGKLPTDRLTHQLICTFMALQHERTLSADLRFKEMAEAARRLIAARHPDHAPPTLEEPKDATLAALNVVSSFLLAPHMFDLRSALLRNRTEVRFVASDNPVVIVNPFYERQFKEPSAGIAAAGAMILLPISPEFTIVLYDTGVYSIEKGAGNAVDIRRASDAEMANELQFLNARSNVYFSDDNDAPRLLEQLGQCKPRRRESDARVAELVESDANATYVRADSPRAKEDPRRSLITFSRLALDADVHFSFLKRRERQRFYHDGSAAGAVRDMAWVRIVREFSDVVRKGRAVYGELPEFARAHARWPDVGPWKNWIFTTI